MLKKIIFITVYIFASGCLFAQTPGEYIEYIENLKTQINEVKSDDNVSSRTVRQLRNELSDIYDLFENENFVVKTDNGLKLRIGNYDKEKQGWDVFLEADIAGRKKLFNQKLSLPYSVFTGKKFTPVKRMTSHQKEDYEYSVEIYNELLNNSGIILSAELNYSIKKWAAASEYRFVPHSVVFYESRNGIDKPLFSVGEKNLKHVTFIEKTQVEIRSDYQIKVDYERCASILESEAGIDENSDFQDESEDGNDSLQSGRRVFFGEVEIREKEPVFVRGSLTWGMGRFGFAGATVGYDLTSIDSTAIYDFGLLAGLNMSITKFFRPYVQGAAEIATDNHFTLKASAGLDFKIGYLLFTAAANYNFDWNLTPLINDFVNSSLTDVKREDYVTYSFGMGVTW
ncbi:hypothetical protein HNP77_000968 [Treponema rectale]|uniref:Uncharacterized protein n=1 Tax=Treponema rectale TaxID=744512 RepID=A0A840S7M3_9SPIR|nr:hypothetical protein [Treponema rectale]MBB5218599.1 hypothetical protein [Treponema rectale]